jgi:hypothetical protein
MVMNSKLTLGLLIAVPLLAGCMNEPIAQRDPAIGEAVRFNSAVQVINPDPVYAEGSAQPGDSGAHAAEAVKKYRKGTVKPVETVGTTSSSGGSGGPQ